MKQVCALSSVLFILTIDPIITAIQRARESIHNLNYADDQAAIQDNAEDL